MFSEFLNDLDASRATGVLLKLQRHATQEWALTGGLAISIHRLRFRHVTSIRALNDVDFVVPRFECIPGSLGTGFLCRHIHPLDPPGKTLAQFVDSESKLRVDVFRAHESVLCRTLQLRIASFNLRLVS